MIFVTVGTHEQQFNRLIMEIDQLKANRRIDDEVFIQTGYSDYEPKHCQWTKFVSFDEMTNYIEKSRIVITHGGPASFLSVLEKHKSPIVVPRKFEFDEHVNNHQFDFAKRIQERGYGIYLVDDIKDLSETIKNFSDTNEDFVSNNTQFIDQFKIIIKDLMRSK